MKKQQPPAARASTADASASRAAEQLLVDEDVSSVADYYSTKPMALRETTRARALRSAADQRPSRPASSSTSSHPLAAASWRVAASLIAAAAVAAVAATAAATAAVVAATLTAIIHAAPENMEGIHTSRGPWTGRISAARA